jgi:hypothetical protein
VWPSRIWRWSWQSAIVHAAVTVLTLLLALLGVVSCSCFCYTSSSRANMLGLRMSHGRVACIGICRSGALAAAVGALLLVKASLTMMVA